jgi:NTE family protein
VESALGLVMTGGGARGAYQAGVLQRIGEIPRVQKFGNPFPVVGGASAGAINGSAVAVGCDQFSLLTKVLVHLWSSLKPSDVFRCDLVTQASNSLTWIVDLSFGGILGGGNARSLLDATPLKYYLKRYMDTERIAGNIRKRHLYALTIAATNYNSGKSYLFIEGMKGHPIWNRSRRVTLSTRITIDHICASAAIPLVFRPVKLTTPLGTAYFGDGCTRLQQPLSPVVRLGANKIFAIGVRGESTEHRQEAGNGKDPSLAQVMGVLFNVMFLDHLATDVEHLERLNRVLDEGHPRQSKLPGYERIRPLKAFIIAPSVDLSELARQHQKDMPYLIQYFVNSLGRDAASCADLMSYLLFASGYTQALIDIGYSDADKRIDEIEDFLFAGNGTYDGKLKPAEVVAKRNLATAQAAKDDY